MSDDNVQFGVLGPLEVRVNEAALPLGTPKQRAVLAMLIINRNSPVGIETLIDAVWGSDPPAAARPNVHSYVSNVRRLISGAGADPHAVVARVAPGYRLTAADDQCDVGRFLAARRSGLVAAAAGQFEEAARSLAGALGEWRGPVLDDLRDFSFVEEFSRVQAENKLTAQIALAEAEIVCGHADSVIGDLEKLTGENPYREPIWAQLITAYYLSHRQADALDAYHRLKSVLAEDLGIDPGSAVRALYHRVLRQLPLDVQRSAKSNAEETMAAMDSRAITDDTAVAALRDAGGRRHLLVGRATRIGRSQDNDIVLADARVSRHHAVIVNNATGFVITDLGSANGVWVAGQRIDGSAALNNEDRISLGDQEFSFETGAEGATASAQAPTSDANAGDPHDAGADAHPGVDDQSANPTVSIPPA